nr:P27 family phage terminase small subunit [Bradyrhizobium sp. 2S1]MCK7667584.1 P27 family phage terminase small subunit [Bradyrhizobium sp. 2S1]
MTNGQLIKIKYGDARQNPLVNIARKPAADMVRFAGEFGLTALARSRIAGGINARHRPASLMGC